MTKTTLLCPTLAVLVLAGCAAATPEAGEPGHGFADERVDDAGKVKLWIPSGWTVDDSNADSLLVSAPDHSVTLDVAMLEGKDLPTALLTVAAVAVIGYDDLHLVGEPVSGDINGMSALFQDGRGTFHGQPVELSVGVIDTPAEKYLLVVGEADTATYAEHEHTIREFMHRIRPL